MTVWQDVQQAIVNFFDWLTGVGGKVAEPMFQLGSWIAQGLSSLGAWLHSAFEWIYSGLEWLGSKFVEGLTWIWQGLNNLAGSLGAALTWVGSGIYSIGQWVWNGLLWLGRTILKALQDAWNWLLQQIINVWNWVVDTVESFVDSINDWWTGFIKSLREKWKEFLIVNMTIPMVWKATEKVITNPTTESVLGWLASPFVGVVTGEILDALLPIPTSKKVTLFPPLKLPRWDYQPITVELPPEPTTPEPYVPSPLPSVGYIPEWQKTLGVKSVYDVEVLYPLLRRFKPSVAIEPTVEAVAPIWVKQPLKVGSKGEVIYAGFETAEVKLKIAAEDVLSAPVTTWQDLAARVKSAYDVEVSPPLVIEQTLGIGAKSFAAIADVLVDGVSNIKAVPSVEVLTPAYVLQKLLGVSSIQRTLVTSTWIYRSAKIDETKSYEATKPPGWVPAQGIGLVLSLTTEPIPAAERKVWFTEYNPPGTHGTPVYELSYPDFSVVRYTMIPRVGYEGVGGKGDKLYATVAGYIYELSPDTLSIVREATGYAYYGSHVDIGGNRYKVWYLAMQDKPGVADEFYELSPVDFSVVRFQRIGAFYYTRVAGLGGNHEYIYQGDYHDYRYGIRNPSDLSVIASATWEDYIQGAGGDSEYWWLCKGTKVLECVGGSTSKIRTVYVTGTIGGGNPPSGIGGGSL